MGSGPFAAGEQDADRLLGTENIAMFVPHQDFAAGVGTYRHLRAAAATIAQAELKKALPPEWEDLHESDVRKPDGTPHRKIPQVLRQTQAFTDIAFKDPNCDAKVFVYQHRWGTGSYKSTNDCVLQRTTFRRARLWSLDGVFLDSTDPEWVPALAHVL